MSQPLVYLASASPRRTELLAQIGVGHRVHAADIDETPHTGEAPDDYVLRMAEGKARAVARTTSPDALVLAADTSVVLGERIFGKPSRREEAIEMLSALAGRRHRVITGVALLAGASDCKSVVVATDVFMRSMAANEIDAYWQSGEPRDKAGAYAIQGRGAVFVERIEGSYSNVVGLPLAETANLLAEGGVDLWPAAAPAA